MINLDDTKLHLACPQCGQTFEKSVGWIKANDTLACTACHNDIALDKTSFVGPIAQAQKAVNEFEKLIGGMKDIKIRL